jgi:hypothetical protein
MLSGRCVRLDDRNRSLRCHRAECTKAAYDSRRTCIGQQRVLDSHCGVRQPQEPALDHSGYMSFTF